MENNASFVRTQMLPPQAPPVQEAACDCGAGCGCDAPCRCAKAPAPDAQQAAFLKAREYQLGWDRYREKLAATGLADIKKDPDLLRFAVAGGNATRSQA